MKKVLVIDDDPDILEAIDIILKTEQYDVLTASNGDDVLEQVAQFKPDLILLDVLLPGSDGREVVKKIRLSGNGISLTPILMMSAHANIISCVKESGANDFIAKPFEINQLILKIETLTQNSYH